MERKPGGNCGCNDKEKTEIAEAAMQFFKVRDLYLADLLTPFVLLGRGVSGGMHRSIITQSFSRLATGDR